MPPRHPSRAEDTAPPPAPAPLPLPDLLGLPRAQLAELLAPVLDRAYRVEQVYRALYEQGVRDFEGMTALGKPLRADLARLFRIGIPALDTRHEAKDGTTKYLFRLWDGASVEAVDIPDGARRTFCISSQAGCAMGCRFCVTGFWGAGRDLTAGEIVGQVLAMAGRLGGQQSLNVVFMGMGEPLLNLDEVERALTVLGEWISLRRITVSTVGVVPGIRRIAAWDRRPNLAVSLHAPDDARRSELMPVNRSWPIAELLAALRDFPLEPGRKLTFEYLLIRGFNDAPRDADALAKLLSGLRAKVNHDAEPKARGSVGEERRDRPAILVNHDAEPKARGSVGEERRDRPAILVNLIPVNPDPVLGERMVPPEPDVVAFFADRLRARGLVATVRRRRGDDVSAACGQLRAFGRDPRGFRRSNLSW